MTNNVKLNNAVVTPCPESSILIDMPEDLEKVRKTFVFSDEYRKRIMAQFITLEQTGTAKMRKLRKAGIKSSYKLPNTVSALFDIGILYSSYVMERRLESGIINAGAVKLRDAHRTATRIAFGTKNLLNVTFDGIGRKKHPVRKIVNRIVKYGLWLIENPYCEGGCAVVFLNKRGVFQSLNGAVAHLNEDGYMQYWLNTGTAIHYVYDIDSPSGYRQGMVPMISIPAEEDKEYYIEAAELWSRRLDWLENMLDISTGGMYSVEKIANAGKELRIDKGIKKVGRQALGVTPSTYLGHLNNLVIYCGDLKSRIEDGEIVAGDGNGLEALESIQELASKKFGYPITEAEAYKFGGQHRINCFVKGHNQVVKRRAILAIIDRLVETGVIKGVITLNRTFEDSMKFAQLSGSDWEGYIVVIGDIENVEYFGDTTCVKCSTDFSQPLELRLMDISHTPHGFIPLSKQGLVQMQLTGNKFIEMYKEVAPNSIDRIFNHVEFDDIDDETGEYVTDVDASQGAYNITTIQKICPQAMHYDEQIKRIATQAVVDTINNRLNRCNLTVKGKYLKLVPDFGRFFDAKLLDADEFYSPGWRHEEDETGFDAVIIRYPLVDFGAFIKGRAVSRREMVRRIRKLKLEAYYEDALFDLLDSVTSAMVMIASMVPGTTNKLSGADFDGDGVCLQSELAVKKVYMTLQSYANDFGGSIAGEVYAKFDYDLGPKSFLYAWALDDDNEDRVPNPAIGIIAGYNVTASSMLAMLLNGEMTAEEIFHTLLDAEMEDEKGNIVRIPAGPGIASYRRLFTVNGSNDLGVDVSFVGKEKSYVDEFKLAVRMSDWSIESCIRMLWDLNAVLSKSMNDVIDAAKNGAQVEVPFLSEIGSRVRSSAVATRDYAEIRMSRSELKIESFTDVCGSVESKMEQKKMNILVNDPIGIMKHRIFELAVVRLRRSLKEEVEQDLEEVSGGISLDRSMKLLADFYQDLMKGEGNDKALAKRQVINMAYALLSQSKINDPEKLLGIVLKASNYVKEDEVPHKYSSFYAQFVEIVQHYVEKFCKDARFEMRVFKFGGGKAMLGQKVSFVNGVSEDGFYVKSRVTGEFCLELDKYNKPIISRSVMDMIPQYEGNNKVAVMKVWKQYFGQGKKRVCLDPDFEVEKRISRIENLRERNGLKCQVKLFNPETQEFVEGDIHYIAWNTVVPALVSNCGPIGYIQIPAGNSTYLTHILNKEYTITNVMKMGKQLETVCVIAEEV